jgi:uncharacterized membrane protein YqjE
MLGNSISKFLKLDSLISNLTGYVETKVELVKVEVKRDVAEGLGKTITYLLLAFVVAMVLMFLSLGVAIVLADAMGGFPGFGLVALFYLLVAIVIFVNREKLSRKFTNEVSGTLNKKKS